MGYRSDVVLAIATTPKNAETLLAAYSILPEVAQYDCLKYWNRANASDGAAVVWLQLENVKWYESYEDVRALNRMVSLCEELAAESEGAFVAASLFLRIGEDPNDVVSEAHTLHGHADSDSEVAENLREVLWDCFSIRREMVVSISGENLVPNQEETA